jgi:hypothetical protein
MKEEACGKKKTRFWKKKNEKKKKGRKANAKPRQAHKRLGKKKEKCERSARAVFRQRELPLEGGGCQRWHR